MFVTKNSYSPTCSRVSWRLLIAPLQQRHAAENAVRKLAVGQRQESRHHLTQMHGQQQAHRRRIAPDQQGQAGQAGEKQQRDEASVHGSMRGGAVQRMPTQIEPQQTCRTDQQADAARRAEQHRQAGQAVGRLPVKT